MRRLLLIALIAAAPALFAGTAATTTTSPEAGAETHATATSDEHAGAAEHHEDTYLGIPGWILKTANMLLFFGVLAYFVGGPVKKAFAERSAAIRAAAQEARDRRERADRMAGEIQARLSAIEAEVKAIQERAQAEGERQKRELVAAAEAESEKILSSARTEVANRLKFARQELTAFAGELAAQRAEQILREKITEQDQRNLFQESLREVSNV